MSKLYFRYGAMNCGKTTALLQVFHNYYERGKTPILLKPKLDSKGNNEVVSRLGISKEVDMLIEENQDVYKTIFKINNKIDCVLVDESQFLSRLSVDSLMKIAVKMDIPVICYGLRTDFLGNPFPGAQRLLEIAHNIEEMKTICTCGKKAMYNMRLKNNIPVFKGSQVEIDNQDKISYRSVCPDCFFRYKEEYDIE